MNLSSTSQSERLAGIQLIIVLAKHRGDGLQEFSAVWLVSSIVSHSSHTNEVRGAGVPSARCEMRATKCERAKLYESIRRHVWNKTAIDHSAGPRIALHDSYPTTGCEAHTKGFAAQATPGTSTLEKAGYKPSQANYCNS